MYMFVYIYNTLFTFQCYDFFSETFKEPGTCQAKIWRCATRVAEGGLEYLDKPEGITG